MLQTPVVLNIFNRADTAERVLERIALAKPRKLFLIADGPRADRDGEAEQCAAARAIVRRVNWECEVVTRFSQVNLGNRRCLSQGYDWVFGQIERAILLEDDCLPEPTFFRFCEELLERYADDTRVMTVGGDNFQFGRKATDDSYYFSRYHHLWGFATWGRAWKLYDADIKLWPRLRDTPWLLDAIGNEWGVRYWTKIFDDIYAKRFDVWDAQWGFAAWANSALGIVPAVNLISNIGFGAGATTTKRKNPVAELPTAPMDFPLRHPSGMIRNLEADEATFANIFAPVVVPNFYRRLRHATGKRLSPKMLGMIKPLTRHIP
jgi:hypothetical protein